MRSGKPEPAIYNGGEKATRLVLFKITDDTSEGEKEKSYLERDVCVLGLDLRFSGGRLSFCRTMRKESVFVHPPAAMCSGAPR